MRHEILTLVLFSWLAAQIPLALFLASFIRSGSTGHMPRVASKVKRVKIRQAKAAFAQA